jgi:hypothetical protein
MATDQELVPGGRSQPDNFELPAGEHGSLQRNGLPDTHEHGAVPTDDFIGGDPGHPAPIVSRAGAQRDERPAGPQAGRRRLVLSVPPEVLELFRRIRRGYMTTADRLRSRHGAFEVRSGPSRRRRAR